MYVSDAVQKGWNENWNDYLSKFEESFAKYIGVKYALCTSSCTGALHLALASLGIKKGDEVIVPDFTWIASVSIINYLGATPIFVDVDPESWTILPEAIEKAITPNTKAIIPVHMYGHPAEMDKIMEIAKKYNLTVIEDAAPSIGAEFKGKKTGSFGEFAAFSFQGAKLLVTGEGGMLLTNNKELYEIAKNLNDHGRDPKIPFWINRIGYKYKMSNMQAAFGLAQLEKIDQLISCKRRIFKWYSEGLESVEGIKLNDEAFEKGAKSIYWMTSILLEKELKLDREEFITELKNKFNIDTRPVFPKISKFPMFKEVENINSEYISKRGINLPSGVCLTKEKVNFICESIKSLLNQLQNGTE
jgi:perosamine synthetase